jgi:hypothetical protein
MKNRIQILGLVLLSISCLSTVKSQQSNLVVKLKNGISNSVSIRNIKKINFAESMMNINVFEGTNAVYSNSDIQKMYFESATEVPSVTEKVNLFIYPNPTTGLIYFKGLTDEPAVMRIYNTSGIQLFAGKINSSVGSFDVSFLPRGIYLLNINNQLAKLIKL